MRTSGRHHNQLRPISFERGFTQQADGSVLVRFGKTTVLCTANSSKGVPRFLQGQTSGWLTAEYSLLPGATHERTPREATRGRQSGRTLEIQRIISRSLRAAIDLKQLGEYTITVDCDVLQADGGTRTAAINGAMLAVMDTFQTMKQKKQIQTIPVKHFIGAVSVGIYRGKAIIDLDYPEDSKADSDINIVMTETGEFVDIQGTAENNTISNEQLVELLALAKDGIQTIIHLQKQTLEIDCSLPC